MRASNAVAQSLYRKYTFKEMGVRRRYYSDNGEDALVMWAHDVDLSSYAERLDGLDAALSGTTRIEGFETR